MNTKSYTSFLNKGLWQKAIIALGLFAAPAVGHTQCMPGWQYNMPVYINNANASQLDTFQVPMYINTQDLVTAGHMNADGSDIRFITSAGCCIELPYHIDSGMNSTATKIWVRVPYIAASGNDTIQMIYGNAAATAASDPVATYDMWEPFDNQVNHFSSACNDGTGTMTVSGGLATFTWGTDAIWSSDSTFGLNHVYTADLNVTSVSGYWPSICWDKTITTSEFYMFLMPGFTGPGGGGSTAYISASGDEGLGYCNEGFLNNGQSTSNDGTGLWSYTWVGTSMQQASYRDIGNFTLADATYNKDEPMKLCIGGIDGSPGTYTIDWVRVHKYAAINPVTTFGAEVAYSNVTSTISYTTPVCKATGDTATVTQTGVAGGAYSILPAGGVINATTGTIDLGASAAGTYTVTYTTMADTCSNPATTTIVINAATVPTVSQTGLVLTAAGTYTSYQWYKGGTLISGATNATYTVTQNGTYYVVVTDANGCTAQSENDIVSNVGIANVASFLDAINVFPNPNNGIFVIDGTAKAEDNKAMIEITDVTGKVLMATTTKIVNNTIHQDIQLNGKIPAGVYMLRITAGTEKKTVRLNVQ